MLRAATTLWVVSLAAPWAHGQANLLTESEFFAAVAEDHPALVVAREGVEHALAAALTAAALAEPELGLLREDPDGSAEQLEVTLSWRPAGPGRRLRIAAAERGVGAAEAHSRADRLDLHLSLHEAYADWAVARQRSERLADHAQRLGELARREQSRADRGESSGLEARRLALAAGRAASRSALADAATATALAAARAWVPGVRDDTLPELPGLPPMSEEPHRPHPRLSALAEEVEASRLSRRAAARIVGWPQLMAGWQRQQFDSGSVEGPIFGLSWPVPVLDRNRAARRRAAAREEAAAARLEASRLDLQAARVGALTAYRRLAAGGRDAHRAIEGNPEMVAAAVAAFAHGEASVTDLLDTLSSALDAELSALDIHAAALAAFRRLEEVAGAPLDADHRPPPQPQMDRPTGDSQ